MEKLRRIEDKVDYVPYRLWVDRYWSVRGKPLDFKYHKYLEQIYEDQSEEIVFMKSAQVGATERSITEAIWLADQFRENAIYLLPNASVVSDLVQERVDNPINDSKYLTESSGRIKKGIEKAADKVGMKKMNKGFVYFRGSNKPTQITSVSGDIVFVDELDRMNPESVPYFDKRLEHSNRKWLRWLSTPTIPNFGIHKKFLESDQHYCYVKCNHCNEWQTLTFFENVDKEKEQIVCQKCRKEIIPYELDLEWRAKEPQNEMRGYYINQLYSPTCNIKKVIKNSLKTDEYEITQFYNQILGLPYEPKGAKISEEDIQSCVRAYNTPCKSNEAYMGIDVGRVLHVIIRDKQKVLNILTVKEFEELDPLMEEYNIKKAVIDALPETRKASEFANRFKGRVSLCYYTGLKEIKDGQWYKDENQKVNTDRTISLDKSNNEIKKQDIHLPNNINDYTEYKEHLKNLVRVIKEDNSGNKKAEYVKTGEDHYRHAQNYAHIAKDIMSNYIEPELFMV